jgi:hypothetical protein
MATWIGLAKCGIGSPQHVVDPLVGRATKLFTRRSHLPPPFCPSLLKVETKGHIKSGKSVETSFSLVAVLKTTTVHITHFTAVSFNMVGMGIEKHIGVSEPAAEEVAERRNVLANTEKSRWQRLWPVIACGAGLFSDGYLNGVIGSVSTMLSALYPKQYTNSPAQSNVSSIAFVGALVRLRKYRFDRASLTQSINSSETSSLAG